MTVVLKDIDIQKRSNNNYSENPPNMYNLNKYREIAKKCISLFAGYPMSSKMIKDEDAIAHVAEHIVWGHLRWKENGGRTLRSYLNQCAIWSIKVWKTKIYQSEKKKTRSLNYTISGDGDVGGSQQYEIISDQKSSEPFDILFNDQTIEAKNIINNKCLTKLQNSCMKQRYLEGKKLREIAETMGVSRQAVNQHIKKAINKLRKHHGVCD